MRMTTKKTMKITKKKVEVEAIDKFETISFYIGKDILIIIDEKTDYSLRDSMILIDLPGDGRIQIDNDSEYYDDILKKLKSRRYG